MESRRPLCAEVSSESAEPLAATASRVDHWLLLEYRGLWSRDVLEASLLSERVKQYLRAQLAALSRPRLLFVRQPERRGEPRRLLFFGETSEAGGRFFSLEFDEHDELLDVDLAAALAGEANVGSPLSRPLFVVCTHGKRDRCCAKFGRPLYEELRAQAEPESVWQSTHVGGDRFAGNVVVLPEGLYFGRVGREEVHPLLYDYEAGRIYLDRYRGRSCYPFHVQAAERAVREATGRAEIDAVRFVGAERAGDGWRVRVRAGGALHEVAVERELSPEPTYLTCEAVMPQRVRRFVARSR